MFDLSTLDQAVADHGRVVRIVVAKTLGSAPRDTGTAMLVWPSGQSGTIGGGTLEYQAVSAARSFLETSEGDWQSHQRTVPLGPELGQCCGGSVTLLYEVFAAQEIATLMEIKKRGACFVRPGIGGAPSTENHTTAGDGLSSGWMTEIFLPPKIAIWVYGAGHVGRALVTVLTTLKYDITWVDTTPDRFPTVCPPGVTPLIAANPADAVRYAPPDARHLILTYSHAHDLEICHRVLSHGFFFVGLIGSATKWARFRKRLVNLGHTQAQINRITCPIGQPELGKSPESIAVGVACQVLTKDTVAQARPETSKERAS